MAGEDLLEIAGALFENAARYARRRVRITGQAIEGGALLVGGRWPWHQSEEGRRSADARRTTRRGRLRPRPGPRHRLTIWSTPHAAQSHCCARTSAD